MRCLISREPCFDIGGQLDEIKAATISFKKVFQLCQINLFFRYVKSADICEDQIYIVFYSQLKGFFTNTLIEFFLGRSSETEDFV